MEVVPYNSGQRSALASAYALDVLQKMKISKFTDLAIAADGGTIVCEVVMDGGETEHYGLDARIPKTKSEREVFKGTYPDLQHSETYPRGSKKEKEIIEAIEAYLNDRCGFLRRESLSESNLAELKDEDLSDGIAVFFIEAINDR